MKSVINLVQTAQGYSIVEGNVEVNKPASKGSKDKGYSLNKKYVQQTFTIYPYILTKEAENHKYLLLPARSLWFNLNLVHEIQKKALPEWFKIKKGILATMSNIKFEKHEELYKKYRNYIIELGKEKYITASEARKGLAGDACAIIRIHKFLEKWGLVNYIHLKPGTKVEPIDHKQTVGGQKVQRKDCFEKDKMMAARSYGKDDLELLKKITKKFRPPCHFCEGICGILWFQYSDTLTLKEIVEIPEKQGKLLRSTDRSVQYKLVICSSCFNDGSYPLILKPQDFQKKNILDHIEQIQQNNDKKRNNEQNKVAQSIEKNKFKIKKTAEQLKMTQDNVFRILMTMPIQKLEKISRIQAQTDAETDEQLVKKDAGKEDKNIKILVKSQEPKEESLVERFTREVGNLEHEHRETYQKFMQSWLLKVNSKLGRLKEWEEGVSTKFGGAVRLEKNLLASKIQSLSKMITE